MGYVTVCYTVSVFNSMKDCFICFLANWISVYSTSITTKMNKNIGYRKWRFHNEINSCVRRISTGEVKTDGKIKLTVPISL